MNNLIAIMIGIRFWKPITALIALILIGAYWDSIKAWFVDLATTLLWYVLYAGLAVLAIGFVYGIVKMILNRRVKNKEENTNLNEQEQ